MDLLLSEFNKKNRNGKRLIESECIIRKRENLLHVCINSIGCRFRNSGSCVMCDYGQGRMITEQDIPDIISRISCYIGEVDSILLGTLGSVLDSQEIVPEYLEKILEYLNEQQIYTIILETHYTSITEQVCQWLRSILPEKDIVVEVGLESVDKFVQNKCLNKNINLDLLQEKIKILHNYHISVTANVFLGAPFLNESEQIEDAEKSIFWAMEHEVDSVVVFPANIRKNTLLYLLYLNDKYERIQHWAIFELLKRIPKEYLSRIYLAWYGDWIDMDESGNATNLPPRSCDVCQKKWNDFYHEFLTTGDGVARQSVIRKYQNILGEGCGCYRKYKEQIMKASLAKEKSAEEKRSWLKRYLRM